LRPDPPAALSIEEENNCVPRPARARNEDFLRKSLRELLESFIVIGLSLSKFLNFF